MKKTLFLLLKKMLYLLIMLLVIMTLAFFLLYLLPGDALSLAGEGVDAEIIAQKRLSSNLPKGLLDSYLHFLQQIIRLDFGISTQQQRPALELLLDASFLTWRMTFLAFFFSISLASIATGIIYHYPKSLLSRLLELTALFFLSMPNFWLAIILQLIFGLWLQILPIHGHHAPYWLILPSLALALRSASYLTRFATKQLAEARSHPALLAGFTRGLKPYQLIIYAISLEAAPILQVMVLQLLEMLGGSILIEQIFGIPGIGQLLINSIQQRDYTVSYLTILYLTLCSLILYIIIDYLSKWLDPRIAIRN